MKRIAKKLLASKNNVQTYHQEEGHSEGDDQKNKNQKKKSSPELIETL